MAKRKPLRAAAAPPIGKGMNGRVELDLDLGKEEKRALDRALESIRLGKGLSVEDFRRKLRRT